MSAVLKSRLKREIMKKILESAKRVFNYYLTASYQWLVPIKKNRFVFLCMQGNSFGDSVKCISDYVEKHYENADIIWAFSKYYIDKVDCAHTKVRFGSLRYFYYCVSSKYFVTNCLSSKMCFKRDGQKLMQTWHGTALKRIALDEACRDHSSLYYALRPDLYMECAKNTDYFISGSHFMTTVYHRAFAYPNKIYEIGTPRNDIYFKDCSEITEKVKKSLSIEQNKKIILYAPTFRSDGSFEFYDVDLGKIKRYFEDNTGNEYEIVARLHPGIVSESGKLEHLVGRGVINASLYPDVQELLYAVDVLVTDYSSVMFDFMYLRRPVIMYVPDRDKYNRGFYFDIDELPFLVANNNDEITTVLSKYDSVEYMKRIDAFLEKIGSVENGRATENAYELLMS